MWKVEFRVIRTQRKFDSNFHFMPGLVIVLSDALSNFTRCSTDYGFVVGVVISVTPEYFNTNRPFFELLRVASQLVLHYVAKERKATATGFERRMDRNLLQLGVDTLLLNFGLW